MRIYKDLDLVEQLGSGIPRILESYSKDSFRFSENFLRMVFPASEEVFDKTTNETPQVTLQETPQVTPQVQDLLNVINGEDSRSEMQYHLGLSDRENFRKNYL